MALSNKVQSSNVTERTNLIAVNNLGRRNGHDHGWLLRSITCEIHAGDRITIVGPTGSGKSLFLRSLSFLDAINVGRITWKGKPVAGNQVPIYRRAVMYLHQTPSVVEGTVEDNLRLPFSLQAYRRDTFDRSRVHELLKSLGRSEEYLASDAKNLSGGESQILAIVRALQLEPDVLLVDEPTSALDERTTQAVETLVLSWVERSALRAVVWVSHDQKQATRIGRRMWSMERGELEEISGEMRGNS